MQFKHPEILYFLGLLILPILVHLFQLQRFVKVPFTNVAFLQKIVLQTRKSSQIKKWLILATRLLMLAALIIAFAQPYFSNTTINKEQNVFLYLDNSLSTNSNGEKGNLLQVAAREIIENLSDKTNYSLITNDRFYKNKNAAELKELLLKIKNTSKKTDIKDVLLKISSEKKASKATNNTILISDFQNVNKEDLKSFNNTNTSFVKLKPQLHSNLSIDSVFVTTNNDANFKINIVVKNQGNAKADVPISIFNDSKLINKQSFSIAENNLETVQFSILKSDLFLGKVTIDFNDTYNFDNTFFFAINNTEKINVLSIGKPADFLNRIYTKTEFNLTSATAQNVNYNSILKQNLIVLNEIESLPTTLVNSLLDFSNKGGTIAIIPNQNLTINSYNQLLNKLKVGKLIAKKNDSLKITTINYKHPLLKNVFEKQVQNFQYPYVKTSFSSSLNNASNLISFEDKKGFIQQINLKNTNLYWLAAPIAKTNSNFTNSPLIVPVFYNIAKQSLQLSKLYYTVGKNNVIDINEQLNKDEILTLNNHKTSFIPLQQSFQKKVKLTTNNQPLEAGFYQIKQQEKLIKNIAYNYTSKESNLDFYNLSDINNSAITTSVNSTLENINTENEIQWFWKWFLALAIVSLLLEILILKFFKP